MKKLLASLLALCLCTTVLVGCGKPTTPTAAVDQFVGAFKKGDTQKLAELYAGDESEVTGSLGMGDISSFDNISDDQKATAESVAKKLTEIEYSLSDEQIDGDTATVKMHFKTYNYGAKVAELLPALMLQGMGSALSGQSSSDVQDQMAQQIIVALQGADKSYEGDAVIYLVKSGDEWKVDAVSNNADLMLALTGGLSSYKSSM